MKVSDSIYYVGCMSGWHARSRPGILRGTTGLNMEVMAPNAQYQRIRTNITPGRGAIKHHIIHYSTLARGFPTPGQILIKREPRRCRMISNEIGGRGERRLLTEIILEGVSGGVS